MMNEIHSLRMAFQKSPLSFARMDIPEDALTELLVFGWLAGRAGVGAGEVAAALKNPVARASILAEALGKSWMEQAETGNKILDKAAELLEKQAEKKLRDGLALFDDVRNVDRTGKRV